MAVKTYNRAERVAQLVHHEIANAMLLHAEDPTFFSVTVTAVKMSRDLSHAKIYVTILNDSDDFKVTQVIASLNRAAGFFRQILAKNLRLRIVPELVFAYDFSVREGAKLSALIDDAVASDEVKSKSNDSN